jgi:AcrR family transcriptional regulator
MAKKAYHHGDLRNALLAAAEQLLEKKGVAAVTLREVAKKAGVSHTAPYRHFEDKQALLSALAQIGYQRLADAMLQCIAEANDNPREQLRLASLAYVRLATSHPQMTYLMFGGVLKPFDTEPALQKIAQRAFEGLLQIIRNGQMEGLYKEKDTQSLAMAVWSQMHGLSMLMTSKHLGELSEIEQEHIASDMVQLLFNGLKSD